MRPREETDDGAAAWRDALPCCVAPDTAPQWFVDAVVGGGGVLVPIEQAEALFWFRSESAGLAELLARAGALRWVQLPTAGVEAVADLLDDRVIWTCAKGVYAVAVAEHALALALAGVRNIADYARRHEWSERSGSNLVGANIVVLGGGGVATAFIRLAQTFDADLTVVRRHPQEMAGVRAVVGIERLHEVLPQADVVVVALALTDETRGILGQREIDLMPNHAWVVNVSCGAHIDTQALVRALAAGGLGGAALDVTEPQPLPADHPLWDLPNCLITPHTANAPAMLRPQLAAFTKDNVGRWLRGVPLRGQVDCELKY